MVTGVACGLQNRYEAFTRLGWVRFPHVPAISGALLIFILSGSPLIGQVAESDSSTVELPSPREDVEPLTKDTIPPITPLGAFARSLILPGWGHLRVGRPGRGAVYFTAEVASLVMVFKSNASLAEANRPDPVNADIVESRIRQRENWIVIAGFVAFMCGIDAWVSTQMWDFEPAITSSPDGSVGVGLQVKLDFP